MFIALPSAWEAVLDATTVILKTSFKFAVVRVCARDVLSAMSDAFASKPIADYVLTNHLRITAIRLRGFWLCIHGQDKKGNDPNSALEGLVYQQVSILEYWGGILKNDVDVDGVSFF